MNNDIYSLYLKCFPEYQCSRACFDTELNPEQSVIFKEYDNDILIAFVMIWNNSISLLCVDSAHQNKGIGSTLLENAEKHITKSGYKKITLGYGSHYLLQGVPTASENTVLFFNKRGYKAKWTSSNIVASLDDFNYDDLDVPELSSDILFRFADDTDREALLSAVDDAQPHWHEVFENCADPVMLAVETETNRIVGFVIISKDGARFINGASYMDASGVIQSARNRGIGRRLVAKGLEWLKTQGSHCVEGRFVALVDWYKALGYQVTDWQWMGEKELC